MPVDVVVVLPGIMGSTLGVARDGIPAGERLVWAPSAGALWQGVTSGGRSITDLELPDGVGDDHPGDGVEPVAVMPTLHGIPGVWTPIHGYSELVSFLEGLGFRQERRGDPWPGNLVVVPYDWRLSNRYNGRRLSGIVGDALARWRAQGGQYTDAKLVFVCHSMGGLVARWFIEMEGGGAITRKLITLGTPWRGAAGAVEQLVNGVRKGVGPLQVNLTSFARSLPSMYQLFPEYACIEKGARYLRTTEMTLPELSSGLVGDGMAFHTALKAAEAARPAALTSTHMIVGTRQPTMTTVRLDGDRVVGVRTIGGENTFGDATVPIPGAVGLGQAANSNLLRRVADQHGHLQSNAAVQDELREILTGESVVYRAPNPVTVRVDVPDLVLAGLEDLVVEVDIDSGENHGMVITVRDAAGGLLAARQPKVSHAHARTAFRELPPTIATVTVTGPPGSPLVPVTATTMIWDPAV